MVIYRLSQVTLIVGGLIALALMVLTPFRAGIGYDAVFETEASIVNRSLDTGLTLQQAYDAAPITSEFYGLLTFQLADLTHRFMTGERDFMSPNEASTYIWQDMITIAMSALAALMLAIAIALALRSRLAGIFSAAALLSLPLWLGMSVFNYKDLPVAAGLTMISAGLVWAWCRAVPKWVIPATLLAALGGFFVLGTRAGAFLLILAVPFITLIILGIAQIWMRHPQKLLPVGLVGAASVGAPILGVWFTNPFARIDLVRWLVDAQRISQQYIWEGDIRTAGMDVPSTDLPWWYVPAWLGAQLPLATGLAVFLGGFAFFFVLLRSPSRYSSLRRSQLLAITPFLVQGVVLPIGIVLSGAVLYDAIRHLLFMFPGLIAIASIGIAWLAKPLQVDPRRLAVAPIVAVTVVGLSLFASVRWFPYSYAFINPIAGWNTDQRSWELDYWGLTSREGYEQLRELGFTEIVVEPEPRTASAYGALAQAEFDALEPRPERHGLYVFLRWTAQIQPEWCEQVFTIERDGHVLGQGGYCPR